MPFRIKESRGVLVDEVELLSWYSPRMARYQKRNGTRPVTRRFRGRDSPWLTRVWSL